MVIESKDSKYRRQQRATMSRNIEKEQEQHSEMSRDRARSTKSLPLHGGICKPVLNGVLERRHLAMSKAHLP